MGSYPFRGFPMSRRSIYLTSTALYLIFRPLRGMYQDGSGASGNRTPRAAMLAYGFLMHRNQPAGQQSTNVNLLYAPYFF